MIWFLFNIAIIQDNTVMPTEYRTRLSGYIHEKKQQQKNKMI